ncbi:MAG: hypothetical protein WDO73_36245 [Ignavibacteriota bacterium]
MVEDGVDVRLVESADALVFTQDRHKFPVPQIVARSGSTQRHNSVELVIIQHRGFHFAVPAPENLHGSPSTIPSATFFSPSYRANLDDGRSHFVGPSSDRNLIAATWWPDSSG